MFALALWLPLLSGVNGACPWAADASVWTDGSLVLDEVTGVSSSGSGFFAHQPGHCWSARR